MSNEKMPPLAKRGGYRRAHRHIEVVAERLDACLCDQALSGQGWDGLVTLWRAAERQMNEVEDYCIWSEGLEDDEPNLSHAVRGHLLAAAASLLDLSSHIEAMRRAER